MTIEGRAEQHIGGGQRAWFDGSIVEAEFVGSVDAAPLKLFVDDANRRADQYGIDGRRSLVVIDLTKLDGFTPAARKVLASNEQKPGTVSNTIVFVVGATIKTKAALALILTAARLVGDVRIVTEYVGSHEDAWRRARAKRDEWIAQGLLRANV
jgi:hypothetical protein